MWKVRNPFRRLKVLARKPALKRPTSPVSDLNERQVSLSGFGPQVAVRLHRAQRLARRRQGE